jgi:hypothetical protein
MSPRFVAFRAETGKKLKRLAGFNESQPQDGERRPSGGYIVMTPSGGIAKRVSNTVTFVECDVYFIAGDGATRTLTANTGSKVWVGNMSTTADVVGSTYVLPTMHGGALLANWEDC